MKRLLCTAALVLLTVGTAIAQEPAKSGGQGTSSIAQALTDMGLLRLRDCCVHGGCTCTTDSLAREASTQRTHKARDAPASTRAFLFVPQSEHRAR